MSLFDSLFPSKAEPAPAPAPAPQAQPAPNQPGSMDGQQQQQMHGAPPIGTAGGPIDPATGLPTAQPVPAAAPPAEIDPMAYYKGMHDAPKPEDAPAEAPVFSLDPEVVTKAAATIDFTKGLDPELTAAVQGGDMSRLPEMMQAIAQNSYAQAMQHTAAVTEQHLGKLSAHQQSQVAPMVRSQLTESALMTDDSYGLDMSNPMVKDSVAQTAKLLSSKHPNAAPEEIAKHAKEYHVRLAATMMGADGDALLSLPGQAKVKQAQQTAQEVDWDSYLEAPAQ